MLFSRTIRDKLRIRLENDQKSFKVFTSGHISIVTPFMKLNLLYNNKKKIKKGVQYKMPNENYAIIMAMPVKYCILNGCIDHTFSLRP